MNALSNITFTLCVVMIIGAVLKIIMPTDSASNYLKVMISMFIVIASASVIANNKFDAIYKNFNAGSYQTEDYKAQLWNKTLEITAIQMQQQIIEYLRQENIYVEDVQVELALKEDNIEVQIVQIKGSNAEIAKKLVAGHFEIGLLKIMTNEVTE